MQRIKLSAPLVLAGLCGAALVGEIVLVHREHARATKHCAALEQKQRDLDVLLRQSPAPSRENEEALVAALDAASRTVAAMRGELGGSEAPVSVGAVEAYFELNRLVDEMGRRAAAAQVAVKAGERFGFASYVSEGPTQAVLPVVLRQRTAVSNLLVHLFDARPLALLSVKRGRPGAFKDDKAKVEAEDYFELAREHSLRESGVLDTDAYRLEFTGQTAVLRQFLNTLAASPGAVVVRTVEVEPLRSGTDAGGGGSDTIDGLQRPQISRFKVTLEVPVLAHVGGTS